MILVSLTWFSVQRVDQREKRDREEHLMNEILEWGKEVDETVIRR